MSGNESTALAHPVPPEHALAKEMLASQPRYPTRAQHLAYTFYGTASRPFEAFRLWVAQGDPFRALASVAPDALIYAFYEAARAIAAETLIRDERELLGRLPTPEIEALARATAAGHAQLSALVQRAVERNQSVAVIGQILGAIGAHFVGLDGTGVGNQIGAVAAGALSSVLDEPGAAELEAFYNQQLHAYSYALTAVAFRLEEDGALRAKYRDAEVLRQRLRLVCTLGMWAIFIGSPVFVWFAGFSAATPAVVAFSIVPFVLHVVRRRAAGFWWRPAVTWPLLLSGWVVVSWLGIAIVSNAAQLLQPN